MSGEKLAQLEGISNACELWRKELLVKGKQKPYIRLWKNKDNGDPGLEYVGRIHYDDTIRASFPFKKNVSSQGSLEIRTDHYLSKWIRTVVTNPDVKKNIIITVDFYGGEMRWSGLLHHHSIKVNEEGLRYHELTFNDDMQYLQFLLGPPNPVLPINIFQFPRVFPLVGPARWAISTMILLNLIRVEGNLWTLPDDPFDPDQWAALVNWSTWQVHMKCPKFGEDDSSLWVLLSTRMNPIDSVIADALDDAQLTLRYRRIFTDLGEHSEGILFVADDGIANGALVFELTDDSGYHSPLTGTFLEGTIADGFVRSVATYVGGFVEDTMGMLTDDQSMYPDQYWGPGFLGTLAQAPWLVVRDTSWGTVRTSELTWSPATAASVVVGGDNPAADAVLKAVIETVGNLIGYFLLGGFSSAGSIASELIMPFLVGTVFAWVYHKNNARATALGWAHLWELYQTGAENNAWSLSALAALRGGFLSSRSETSHTLSLNGTGWILPGLQFTIGQRIGSTAKEYPNFLFAAQVEEISPSWDHTNSEPMDYEIKVGQNKASMTLGERQARALQKALNTISNIGVHLIS